MSKHAEFAARGREGRAADGGGRWRRAGWPAAFWARAGLSARCRV